MAKKKAPPLTFAEQQERTRAAEAAKRARQQEAVARDEQARGVTDARRAENAQMRVQGAKIYEDDAGNMISGKRTYCFDLLLKHDASAHKAVLWLEDVLRTAEGQNSKDRRPDYIRASGDGAPGQHLTDAQLDASDTLAAVEENMRPKQIRMLFALLKPDDALPTHWHRVVEGITGEKNPVARATRVKDAAEALAWVRQNIDRLKRERRERKERLAA